jgi:hypothetical protein
VHKEQSDFCLEVKTMFPTSFNGVYVLDVGSLDINGNNRYLFEKSNYLGIDIIKGKNVDVVMPIHEYKIDKKFDTVISTEMLEHDIFWKESIYTMYNLLKGDGLLVITCATTGRKEHGTLKSEPKASPATPNYYKNITKEMFEEVVGELGFSSHYIQINNISHDLYFYGIKK